MRRRINGYTNFGGYQFPILPQQIILTDRADGTRWLLSHNRTTASSDGLGSISIDDAPNLFRGDYRIYSPDEGPILATDPTVRLIVRGGYLGVDIEALPTYILDLDQSRVLTRRGTESFSREIIEATSSSDNYPEFAWTTIPELD